VARQVVAHARRHGGGSVPVGLQRCADGVLEPAVDWRTELRSVVSNRCAAVAGRRDCTYARPSRRQMVPGVVLPSMIAPGPPTRALVLDTSGSMSTDQLTQGIAEVAGIRKQVYRGRSTLHVIACDAAVADAQLVRRAADVRLVGRGGTDMRIGMRPRRRCVPRPTSWWWPLHRGAHRRPAPGAPDWMRTIVVVPG
jgi:predicted metal-dependent peptidase